MKPGKTGIEIPTKYVENIDIEAKHITTCAVISFLDSVDIMFYELQ